MCFAFFKIQNLMVWSNAIAIYNIYCMYATYVIHKRLHYLPTPIQTIHSLYFRWHRTKFAHQLGFSSWFIAYHKRPNFKDVLNRNGGCLLLYFGMSKAWLPFWPLIPKKDKSNILHENPSLDKCGTCIIGRIFWIWRQRQMCLE